MRTWTEKEQFQHYEDLTPEEVEALKEKVNTSIYRQTYHIQPPTGVMQQMSGLIFYNHTHFIQTVNFPNGTDHQLPYWYHFKGDQLTHLKPHHTYMTPEIIDQDRRLGDGSSFIYDNDLYMMFTTVSNDDEPIYKQHVAKLTNDGSILKQQEVVITHDQGDFNMVRDPNVVMHEGRMYAFLGGQNQEGKGTIIVYKAVHPFQWTYVGEVQTSFVDESIRPVAPDYFRLNHLDFIIYGFEEKHQASTRYLTGYAKGMLEFNDMTFTHSDFKTLDDGFDFYAPKTFLNEHKARVLFANMSMPDVTYPSDKDQWRNCLTVPRVLTIENGDLKQRPLEDLKSLRYNEETALGYATKFNRQLHPFEGTEYELIVDILENDATELYFELRASKFEATHIIYNKRLNQLTLDRSESGPLPEPCETRTSTTLKEELKQLRIFVDASSIEIFCNDGERVLSSRIFPSKDSKYIRTSTESGQVYMKLTKYDLKSIIEEPEQEESQDES
ncbi:GH32 C-terminal domain-containing protein [Staphylococcus massiliensis]|uniref:GH32 C-terminal domain-containing protein n=1 Tax=Staphylococcus massiliensis TaxID=555791 RepID=UPI001EE0F388|nr:GH32 C-terminal domain-containing protein [Staphylococcus massiliensis]MCG3402881.1 GH32 C-terminal domain-containing protein [Staphylococcus massiliensis]